MNYSITTTPGKNLYVHHCPKPTCQFCRKNGRAYIREPSICVPADSPKMNVPKSSRNCEYHNILEYFVVNGGNHILVDSRS